MALGIRRTYGAAARFEITSVDDFESDWRSALEQLAQWRASRAQRARSVDLHFIASPELIPEIVRFLGTTFLHEWESSSRDLGGLRIDVAVFGSLEMELYLDLTLYPDFTCIGYGLGA